MTLQGWSLHKLSRRPDILSGRALLPRRDCQHNEAIGSEITRITAIACAYKKSHATFAHLQDTYK